ncbi:MAG TPA: hypothetical protein VF278_08910 [Pirellulales bacterium]
MTNVGNWPEIDSRVHRSGLWPAFLVGLVFLLLGMAVFAEPAEVAPLGMPLWIIQVIAAYAATLGAVALVILTVVCLVPVNVRHAAADVLPDVPSEPVIQERTWVQRALKYELTRDGEAWCFRPAPNHGLRTLGVAVGFALGSLPVYWGCAIWAIHEYLPGCDWPTATHYGTWAATCLSGLTAIVCTIWTRRHDQTLCSLRIPVNGENLEFSSTTSRGAKAARQRQTIPRELVIAVQLCPCKYVYSMPRGKGTIWAVQGLLVLAAEGGASYQRLPILLTIDVTGAARLMQQLAATLVVPYLYDADSAGWQAEKERAQDRSILRHGGMRS